MHAASKLSNIEANPKIHVPIHNAKFTTATCHSATPEAFQQLLAPLCAGDIAHIHLVLLLARVLHSLHTTRCPQQHAASALTTVVTLSLQRYNRKVVEQEPHMTKQAGDLKLSTKSSHSLLAVSVSVPCQKVSAHHPQARTDQTTSNTCPNPPSKIYEGDALSQPSNRPENTKQLAGPTSYVAYLQRERQYTPAFGWVRQACCCCPSPQ